MDAPLLPEQKARRHIDSQLAEAGWCVVSRNEYTPAAPASAVTEGLMQGGTEADYLLFVDNRVLGIVEAKRAENSLGPEVATQAEGYAKHPLDWYVPWKTPIPFIYLANGNRILFRDLRDPDSDYHEVARFHSPGEMLTMLGVSSEFGALPALRREGLRACQFEAVSALERSFRRGDDRALVVLATGAGKTFTACTFSYRFLAHTPIRRILFLVDRNNLGKQAHGEFGMYRLTESGEPFTSIYDVQRLSSADPETAKATVVISTIQRLYSFLERQPAPPDDEDEPDSVDPDAEDALPDVSAPGPDAANLSTASAPFSARSTSAPVMPMSSLAISWLIMLSSTSRMRFPVRSGYPKPLSASPASSSASARPLTRLRRKRGSGMKETMPLCWAR